MSEELKPCPFCGATYYTENNPLGADPVGWMSKDSVGKITRGPECGTCGATAATVEDWNTRVDEHAATTQKLSEANQENNRLKKEVEAEKKSSKNIATLVDKQCNDLQSQLTEANKRIGDIHALAVKYIGAENILQYMEALRALEVKEPEEIKTMKGPVGDSWRQEKGGGE